MCEFQFGISAAVLESNGNLKGPLRQIIAPGTAHHNTTPPPSSAYAYFTYIRTLLSSSRCCTCCSSSVVNESYEHAATGIMASSSAPPRVPQTDAECRNMTELSTRIAAVGDEVKNDPAFRFMNASVRNASVLARLMLAMTYHM